MPSSKGKPTDPQKREEARKEVLNMEKGGGKGNWSAWKVRLCPTLEDRCSQY